MQNCLQNIRRGKTPDSGRSNIEIPRRGSGEGEGGGGVGRGRGEGCTVYNMHKQIKPFAEAQNCIGLQMHLVQEAWQIFAEF